MQFSTYCISQAKYFKSIMAVHYHSSIVLVLPTFWLLCGRHSNAFPLLQMQQLKLLLSISLNFGSSSRNERRHLKQRYPGWNQLKCCLDRSRTETIMRFRVCIPTWFIACVTISSSSNLIFCQIRQHTQQCDQIWRFIGLWPTFKCFWQHLICPNLSHS